MKQAQGASLQHLFHGVISLGLDEDAVLDRCRAFEPLLRPGEAFSHSTGFLLLGGHLPGAIGSNPELHLTHRGKPRNRAGVLGHRSDTVPPIVFVGGLPVIAPATLWCQLSTALGLPELVAAGDFLVTTTKHREALSTVAGLVSAVAAHGSRRGRRVLDAALPLVRSGPDSRPESLLRVLLVDAGLPEPVIHYPISVGGLVLHPDLSYPEFKIAIEYEGDQHRSDRTQWRRDLTRYELLQDAGWRVIRVHADDLFGDPGSVTRRVRGALRAALI